MNEIDSANQPAKQRLEISGTPQEFRGQITTNPISTVTPQADTTNIQIKPLNKPNELKKSWYLPILFAIACLIIFIFWQSKWLTPSLNNNFSFAGPYCDEGACTPAVNVWMKLSIVIYSITKIALAILVISYVVINLRKHILKFLKIIKTIIKNHTKLISTLLAIFILFALIGFGFILISIAAIVLAIFVFLAAIYSNKILPLKLVQHLNLNAFYKLIILLSIISVAVILTGIIAASKSGCIQNNSNAPSDNSTTYYLHCVIPGYTTN